MLAAWAIESATNAPSHRPLRELFFFFYLSVILGLSQGFNEEKQNPEEFGTQLEFWEGAKRKISPTQPCHNDKSNCENNAINTIIYMFFLGIIAYF